MAKHVLPKWNKGTIEEAKCPRGKQYADYWSPKHTGLHVRVSKTGSRTFRVRYRDAYRKQRVITLGRLGALTVQQAIAQWKTIVGGDGDAAEQRDKAASAKTTAKVVENYIDEADLKEVTRRHYRGFLRRFIKPHRVGEMPSPQVTIKEAREVQRSIGGTKDKDGHYSGMPTSANQTIILLHAAWEFAGLERNPWRYGRAASRLSKLPAGNGKRRQPLPDDKECARFWTVLDWMADQRPKSPGTTTPDNRDVLRFMYLTGMRADDVLSLTFDDIDADGVVSKPTKSGDKVFGPLGPTARAMIEKRRKIAKAETPDDPRVFAIGANPETWEAKVSKSNTFRGAWLRVRRHHRFGFTAHKFRGVWETVADECGLTDGQRAQLLGHSESRSMPERYTVRELKTLTRLAKAVDDALRKRAGLDSNRLRYRKPRGKVSK